MIPSLPGFSSPPAEIGWGLDRIGRAWDTLMKRLGYTHYVAQGGDWGGGIVERMARQAPEGLLGIHTNLAATFPPDAAEAIDTGAPAPEGLSEIPNLIYFNEAEAGGHFPAWEVPDVFATEVRAAFRSLR